MDADRTLPPPQEIHIARGDEMQILDADSKDLIKKLPPRCKEEGRNAYAPTQSPRNAAQV